MLQTSGGAMAPPAPPVLPAMSTKQLLGLARKDFLRFNKSWQIVH